MQKGNRGRHLQYHMLRDLLESMSVITKIEFE